MLLIMPFGRIFVLLLFPSFVIILSNRQKTIVHNNCSYIYLKIGLIKEETDKSRELWEKVKNDFVKALNARIFK
jgi:hypothetical protein